MLLFIIFLNNINNVSGLDFELYIAYILKTKGYTNIKLTEKYALVLDNKVFSKLFNINFLF